MREFITYVDGKGHDAVAEFIKRCKQPDAEKILVMLEKLSEVDELKMPYYKTFRGYPVTLGELRIGPFRIFVHRLAARPGEERFLLVHAFRKKSNETPAAEINRALKRIQQYRHEQHE